VETQDELKKLVLEAIKPLIPSKRSWQNRLESFLVNRWQVKLGSFALVCFFWLLLAGQQDFQVNMNIPIDVKNIPADVEVLRPLNPEVRITFRGLRKDASTLNERNVHVEMDLSLAQSGKKTYSITRDQITLPNDRIQIVRIEPAILEFEFRSNAKINTEAP